ncbi:MAG: F0F1 ATP synthase subunit epsilon [Chromatiaceae bacterium]|nr:F0F1 ATP synthase subunit epsilon [Gammaproteobacteria bacterium]MCP5303892.1 F0F1 ATP synthase subunit epsilon [Chromatiaceae bacterium]MCP5313619.1 F0F1 ATP synthase subunit epsilon [Chromatiaceae bacterium]
MSGFTLQIQDATQTRDIDDVRSFVGSDASGSFGLLPGHARLITTLRFGLARFRVGDGGWQYLAVPGAVLYFAGTRLWIGTRRYLLDDDYGRISRVLGEQLAAEEQELHSTKDSLRRMEEALLRRLWQLGQAGG